MHGPYSSSLGDRGSCTFYIYIDSVIRPLNASLKW